MGNPKQKWTQEEEDALVKGIAKHGPGKWKCIQKDPEFHSHLSSRTNIDLKDKWRNMSVSNLGPRDKSRSKPKVNRDAPATPVPPANNQIVLAPPAAHELLLNNVKEEPVKDSSNTKNVASDTTAMIFEALAKDQNGLDIGSIYSYIEQRTTIKSSQSFRKQLGAKLRRLVHQEKLEKVDNCYKLKNNTAMVETSRKDIWPTKQQLVTCNARVGESLEEAAKTAAYKVAEAEEKSYHAALAVREHERFLKMQEETYSTLQLAKEIYDRCLNGEIVLVA